MFSPCVAAFTSAQPLFFVSQRGPAAVSQRHGVAVLSLRSEEKVNAPYLAKDTRKRVKRVLKARERLLELVPHEGDFPTLREIEAVLTDARTELGAEMMDELLKEREDKKSKKDKQKKKKEGRGIMPDENCDQSSIRMEAIDGKPTLRELRVCQGKSCSRKGAAAVLSSMQSRASPGYAHAVPCKCLDKCKEPGITVQSVDEQGIITTYCVDEPSVMVGAQVPRSI